MIEMHELEQAWNDLDERLERQDLALRQIRRKHGIDAISARLRQMSLAQIIQLTLGLMIALWAGGYWFDHLGQTHLVIYGLTIHFYGLALLITSVLQLRRLARLDYRQPVLDMQRQLVALRRLHVGSERTLLICGFVVWVPVTFIALRAIGVDVWISNPAAVLWNLLVGLGLSALVAWLTYRFRDAFERDAAGRCLRAAEAELAELTKPEHSD
jgi:hypothetical protein